jgi:SAM-dependent methyltransferase
VPHEKGFDAVLTATALHWLAEPDLTRLYADLARLVRAGGIYCNADHMPLVGAPRLSAAVNAATVRLQEQARAASGALDWDSWWAAAAAEPALAELMIERGGLFEGTGHPVEFTPPATWHVTRLRHGGFAEAAVIWRDRADGVIAAVR